VSLVASLAPVREALVEQQRAWANRQSTGVVVEGRDMTTVVFPSAAVKIFLTADVAVREARRGSDPGDSVRRRDEIDSTTRHRL
jgi:cytidylate kinase